MIRIDIVSDVVCPWCFVGKRRLERALAAEPPGDIVIGWRPFQLNPDLPPDGMDRREYMRSKFGEERIAEIHKRLTAIGLEEGIPFDFDAIKRAPNTLKAHRLIRLAETQGKQDQIVEALFTGYFMRGQDVGDSATLAKIAAEAGLDEGGVLEFLDSDLGESETVEEIDFARRVGVNGVPCFIVERKYAISGAQPPEAFANIFARIRAGDVEVEG
jgi:predicted DsbA family dithiol-disulfide isomerase